MQIMCQLGTHEICTCQCVAFSRRSLILILTTDN